METEIFQFFKNVVRSTPELESILDDTSFSKAAAERVLSVDNSGNSGQITLNFAADGLDLRKKIAAERVIHQKFFANYQQLKLHVNFKRVSAKQHKTKIDMPASSARRKPSPFGLNIDKRKIPGVKSLIAIASGKGGVGKSTISTNLAVALAKIGLKVGVLDADIYGPSIPVMLGIKGSLTVDDEQKITPLEGHGVKCVSFGFMSDTNNPVLWKGPLVSKAIEQFLFDVNWGELDFLVVDLPPGTGDVQMSLVENVPIDKALIVTTPQDVALIDAKKAVTMFEKLSVPILGIIENMAIYKCTKCGFAHNIFGNDGVKKFAESKGLNLLAELPLNPTVGILGDKGEPAVLSVPDLANDMSKIINSLDNVKDGF